MDNKNSGKFISNINSGEGKVKKETSVELITSHLYFMFDFVSINQGDR